MPLRVGQIDYANCVPLFRALQESGNGNCHRYVQGVPATLNGLLAKGEIDLCPSSSIVYAVNPSCYWLLPGLSISAIGPVQSVLLFSRRPLEELNGCRIGLTSESDTSVALLRILLATFCGFANEFQRTDLPLAAALTSFSALLLIGDVALRESIAGHHCHVYDLGELWYRFTGLPFVFALWIVNRAAVAGREDEVRLFAHTLLEAKERSRQRISSYATDAPGLGWLEVDRLAEYWRTISYELGDQEIKGLTTFYRHAAELGLIASPPELVFLPGCTDMRIG